MKVRRGVRTPDSVARGSSSRMPPASEGTKSLARSRISRRAASRRTSQRSVSWSRRERRIGDGQLVHERALGHTRTILHEGTGSSLPISLGLEIDVNHALRLFGQGYSNSGQGSTAKAYLTSAAGSLLGLCARNVRKSACARGARFDPIDW